MKYIVAKVKGIFYAGSEKVYEKGLKLKKYLNPSAVANMAKAFHLSFSSLIFKGVSKGEQSKIAKNLKAKPAPAKIRKAPAKKKAKKKGKK